MSKKKKAKKKTKATASGLKSETLAVFEKRVNDLLIDYFKKGKLEGLFSLIKAYSPEFGPNTFYRLALVSKVHRTRPESSTVEWANLVGQLCLSPGENGDGHVLSLGTFSAKPFHPCPSCQGDANDPKSIGKPSTDPPAFLADMEGDMNAALWETLEEGGLWDALRGLREAGKAPVAGPEYTYQIDFRSEYITRDKKTEQLTPKRLTVIGTISFPFQASTAKKTPPLPKPTPGMEPADPCQKCQGSGFAA